MTETLYIDNDNALAKFFDQAGNAPFAALDTEFMREKTYYPRLCLIQISINDQIACIDPFTITEFGPMLELFNDRKVTKVLHSVSQDMEVFLHTYNCLPAPIHDTQVAASLMGMGDQVSYAKLVNEMLGITIDKSHTRTDWTRRPLDKAQLKYAADDVRYLAEIYPLQCKQLGEQGRLEWLEEDFTSAVEADRYRPAPDNAWRRVKGYARLGGQELAILSMLAKYREEQAIKRDRPRRFILSDDQLIDLVKSKPRNTGDLQRRRGFSDDVIKRHGSSLLECISQGLAVPKAQWPETGKGKPLSNNQEILADMLMALLKYQAKKNNVSVNSMASRGDVEQLVRGKSEMALMHGWRYELGGRVLQEFLQGELTASVHDRQLKLAR